MEPDVVYKVINMCLKRVTTLIDVIKRERGWQTEITGVTTAYLK